MPPSAQQGCIFFVFTGAASSSSLVTGDLPREEFGLSNADLLSGLFASAEDASTPAIEPCASMEQLTMMGHLWVNC